MNASSRPHACVALAVDPGATSGWAVLSATAAARAVVVCSGTARTATQRAYAARAAVSTAAQLGMPLVVAMEKWSNHGAFGNARTQRGLGSAAGRWLEQIEAAGIPKRRVVRVKPETWRPAVIGMRTGGRSRVTGDECRAAAITYVRRRFGIDAGADEAEAVCIAVFAMHSDEVARALPKRRARQ